MQKSKLPRFLILGIVVLALFSAGTVFAQEDSGGKWVLVETQINPENKPLSWELDDQYKLKYASYSHSATITVTSASHDIRAVSKEDGEEFFDWTFDYNFQSLPNILIPGDRIELAASATASGSGWPYGYGTLGYMGRGIDPRQSYFGATPNIPTSSKNVIWIVPQLQPQDPDWKLEISIAGRVCPPCLVTWVYQQQEEETPMINEASAEIDVSTEEEAKEDTSLQRGEFIPSGPFNQNCSLNQDEIDRDWLKYSDFDEAIPFGSRSYESQQYHNTLDRASEIMLEAYLLDRDMAVDRLMRREMRDLRDALRRNLRQNLIKSFIRLSWLTYDTINAGVSGGGSFGKVVANAEATGLQQILAVTNAVRANIPENSSIAINTNTTSGKFMAVGAAGVLSAMGEFVEGDFSSMGLTKSATTVGVGLVGDAITQSGIIPPGPKLTQADFDLLKEQYERNRILDKALAESYRINSERRDRINEIGLEVAALKKQADNWESKEKERVQRLLEEDCRRQKARFEEGI